LNTFVKKWEWGMDYVEVRDNWARVEMPSTVAELHKAHKARLRRLFPKPILEISKPKTKEPWFAVIEDITDRELLIDDITVAVSRYFNLPKGELHSYRRGALLVRARHIAYYIAKSMTPHGTPWIGRFMGGKDHTSVLHGTKKIVREMLLDWELAYDIAQIEASLR
jgi:chromosomal replication initiation ATPase DnaA